MENFARMLGIGHRQLRERLRARAPRDRRRALARRRTCSSTAPSRRPASRALPALWKRVTVALAEGGADAGVIGAGLLAAQELARERDTDLPQGHD